jgi:cysteine-rich repeat protein/parallel beta-helix repeat protein
MRGQHAMGITVYGTEATPISDLIIDANEIYDCEPYQSEALVLNGNVTAFTVTNNVVRDVNNIGIDFIGGETDIQPDPTKVARNGVCRGNHVLRAKENGAGGYAAGIYIDGGRDIVVEGNVVSGCDIGIEVGAENAGTIASGNIVRDNVVIANEKAGIAFGGYAAGVGRANDNQFLHNTCYQNDTLGEEFGELWIQYGSNNAVRNNLFVSTSQNILVASYGGNMNTSLDYNLWFTAAGAGSARFIWNGTEHVGFAAYQAATNQDASSLFANPQLATPAAGDIHLLGTSPAINAGDPAFVPAPGEVDIDGQPRVTGVRVDIGADETGFCGNGMLDPGEQCDDNNLASCDGCDSNCTTSACGNGVLCPGETCDDGNVANGDCCAAGCVLDPPGTACDDANLCTAPDTCDGAGACTGAEVPAPSCFEPGPQRASLLVKANANPARGLLLWKWGKGDDVDAVDLGNPTATTDYALCVYDYVAGVPGLASSIPVPAGAAWQASGDGFKFTAGSGGPGGVRKIRLKPGFDGRAKVLLKAKGAALQPPTLPLTQSPRVVVQLKNAVGACWQGDFGAPADRNTVDQFRDRGD